MLTRNTGIVSPALLFNFQEWKRKIAISVILMRLRKSTSSSVLFLVLTFMAAMLVPYGHHVELPLVSAQGPQRGGLHTMSCAEEYYRAKYI